MSKLTRILSVLVLFLCSIEATCQGTQTGTGKTSGTGTFAGAISPAPLLSTITVAPTTGSQVTGSSFGFTCNGNFSDGSVQDLTTRCVWTSQNTSIATVGSSADPWPINCVGVGSVTIQAVFDTRIGLGVLQCQPPAPPTLTSIKVTPVSPSANVGQQQSFQATCTYSDSSTQDCTLQAAWLSSNLTNATLASPVVDPEPVSCLHGGTSTISASIIIPTTTVSDSTTLTCVATLTSVAVTPSTATCSVSNSVNYIATGTYSDGSQQDVTLGAVWTSSSVSTATVTSPVVNPEVVTCVAAGPTTIKAAVGTLNGTSSLTVTQVIDLVQWSIMPDVGQTPDRVNNHLSGAALKYYWLDSDRFWWEKGAGGNPWDIEAYGSAKCPNDSGGNPQICHWITEDGDPADQAACIAAGYTSCFVDPFAYKRFITPLTVAPRFFTLGGPDVVITHSGLSPYKRTTNCEVDAQPTLNLNNAVAITHDAGVMAFGGSIGNQRSVEIIYHYGLNSVTPPYTGGQQEIFDIVFPFGQVEWRHYAWNASIGAYVLDQTSLNASTVAPGAPTPNFPCGGVNTWWTPYTQSNNHSGVLMSSLAVTPVNPTINVGNSIGFVGTATYSDTTKHDVTLSSTWTSSNVVAATLASPTVDPETAIGVAAGTSTITAAVGSISGSTLLTVQNVGPTLSSVTLAPKTPQQFNGSAVQYTLTGNYSDGTTKDVTLQAAWVSSAPTAVVMGSPVTDPEPGKCIVGGGTTSFITGTFNSKSDNTIQTCNTVPTACGPPTYLCSRSDLVSVPNPAVPPKVGPNNCTAGSLSTCGNLTGANTVVVDPDFHNRIVRATDVITAGGGTITTSSGGSNDANMWNHDSTMFLVQDLGTAAYLMSFNPTTMQSTKLTIMPAMPQNSGWAWSYVNPKFLFRINLSKIYKYDLTGYVSGTPPAPTVMFDFASDGGHCLDADPNWLSNPKVVTRTIFTSSTDDQSFQSGFSNAGGQNTGFFSAVYTIGKGCRMLDSKSGIIYGDWGTLGAINIPDRWTFHDNEIGKSGDWLTIGFSKCLSTTCYGSKAGGIPYFWQIATNKLGEQAGCLGGHSVTGHAVFFSMPSCNALGDQITRPYAQPTANVFTHLITNYPTGITTPFDGHFSWANDDALDTYCPIWGSQHLNSTITFGWAQEILCTFPANVGSRLRGTTVRFAHSFTTSKSQTFDTQWAIGHASQDGRFFMFASDWLGTLGATNGAATCTIGTNCRGDVFIVELDSGGTSASVQLFPSNAVTVEHLASEPFSAVVNNGVGSQTGTWAVAAGTGTISSSGIFTAPNINESDTIRFTCTGGVTCSTTKTVTVSGAIPTYSCAWTQGSGAGGDSTCTMTHDTVTRNFTAHVPPNYVSGTSGLWIALSGGDVLGSFFCINSGAETQGPARYVDALSSPAPIVVCPDPLKVGTTPNWHSIDYDTDVCARTWTPNVCPNDSDFVRQIILTAKKDKNIDLKKVMVFGLWDNGSNMAQRVALDEGDLIATVGVEELNWRNPRATNPVNGPPSVPASIFPVSVIGLLTTSNNASLLTICGTNNGANDFSYNEDDEVAYWATVNNITTFDVSTTFCGGQSGTNYTYTSGTTFVNKWLNAGSLLEKDGTGGILNTEIRIWTLKGGTNQMYCSPNTGCSPVVHFITGACSTGSPCNTQMTSGTGDTVDDLLYNFWLAHPKP